MSNPTKVVDLFAGPGGLGEGFASYETELNGETDRPFKIIASVEKDPVACQTLQLRAFYRHLGSKGNVPEEYFDFIDEYERDNRPKGLLNEFYEKFRAESKKAHEEVMELELGQKEGNKKLNKRLRKLELRSDDRWVLIGGPPCQAYSLVGRARNRGIKGYKPEEDQQHYLYKEYLRILRERKPAVFVMENVKGILSSSPAGEPVFPKILNDLKDPNRALGKQRSQKGKGYRLYSMTTGECKDRNQETDNVDPRDFILKAEDYGIPQRRHRVFVLGVREDIECVEPPILPTWKSLSPLNLVSVIGELPQLRSGLSLRNSEGPDQFENWRDEVVRREEEIRKIGSESSSEDLFGGLALSSAAKKARAAILKLKGLNTPLERNAWNALDKEYKTDESIPDPLGKWFKNKNLHHWPNHETRSHIREDLGRYLFAAAWGKAHPKSSPKACNFPKQLSPEHRNWGSGKFSDRFRVQLADEPATTITSHISKDGHYFIHYDPMQCRSLTVREAARVQTFPDDYFFMGPRTEQYRQVGNAVPPFLAHQVAKVVAKILKKAGRSETT